MMALVLRILRIRPALSALIVLAIAGAVIACSATATAPLGAVVATPNSLTFTCALTPMTFSVTQQNFSGTFTAVTNDATVVTVAPTSPPGTFVVTPQAGTGATTTITVTGGGSMTATVNATLASCICHRHHDMWSSIAR